MALSLDQLPDDVATLKALLLAVRAETQSAHADNARLAAQRDQLEHEHTVLAAEVDRLTQQNERLDHIIGVLRRAQFGRKSERISDDQIALALEDVETAFGAEDAAAEKKSEIVKREGIGAPIAAISRSTCPVRRSSSSRRPRRARAAAVHCMSLARMSPSASTRSRPGFA